MMHQDLDEVVLNVFQTVGGPMRASDVHANLRPVLGSKATLFTYGAIGRIEIESSIDRLLQLHLIKDVTADMDWHPHYKATSLLDSLAAINTETTRRRSGLHRRPNSR